MFKARLSPEAITKVRNYTGFSAIELLVVVAIMVCWPRTPVGYARSPKRSYEAVGTDELNTLP
jgi:hypothetical protein